MPQCRNAWTPGGSLCCLFGRRKDRDYRAIASFPSTNTSVFVGHAVHAMRGPESYNDACSLAANST